MPSKHKAGGCNCCDCPPPTVICARASGSSRVYDYTITDATSAWYVKTCYDENGTATDTTVTISPAVSGSFTAEINCKYVVYASNACGESSDTCSDPQSGCIPCGTDLGNFVSGYLQINGIPDAKPPNCSAGYGYQTSEWYGFSDWNGAFIWDTATFGGGSSVAVISLGTGYYKPNGASAVAINFGIRVQCTRADLIFDTSSLSSSSSAVSTGLFTLTNVTSSGKCSYKRYAHKSSSVSTYETCPFNAGFAVPPLDLCAWFGSWEYYLITEFS